ncbi:MAG: WD40/YVTN/BNR-like repeat-containing protein, partial [Nostoc sp.]
PPRGSVLLSGVADVDGFNHSKGLDTYPSTQLGGTSPRFQDTYSFAYSESNPARMVRVGGNRWNNTYTGATSTDGGQTWKKFSSFPQNTMPLRVAMSATNPNLFVAIASEGQAIRTTDGGSSWSKVSGLPKGPKGPWYWGQPLAADKVNGNIFYYYSRGKVYRSSDEGASFSIVNSSLP